MKKAARKTPVKPKSKATANKKAAVLSEAEAPSLASLSESLMPELEELVKKNPNRLIGCGG